MSHSTNKGRRQVTGSRPVSYAAIVRRSAWGLCAIWTIMVMAAYLNGGRRLESAIQQAARAADAAVYLIGGYVAARCAVGLASYAGGSGRKRAAN